MREKNEKNEGNFVSEKTGLPKMHFSFFPCTQGCLPYIWFKAAAPKEMGLLSTGRTPIDRLTLFASLSLTEMSC